MPVLSSMPTKKRNIRKSSANMTSIMRRRSTWARKNLRSPSRRRRCENQSQREKGFGRGPGVREKGAPKQHSRILSAKTPPCPWRSFVLPGFKIVVFALLRPSRGRVWPGRSGGAVALYPHPRYLTLSARSRKLRRISQDWLSFSCSSGSSCTSSTFSMPFRPMTQGTPQATSV